MHKEIAPSDNKVNSKKALSLSRKRAMSETTRNRRNWWNLGSLRATQSLRSSSAPDGSLTPNGKLTQSCSLPQTSGPTQPDDARIHRKTMSKIDEQVLWEMSAIRQIPKFTF